MAKWLFLTVCLLLTACSQTTLIADNTSGFGGTGVVQQYANGDEEGTSGFGGTGIVQQYAITDDESSSGFGGTGIVGNISAFGSIWVNGIEVDYAADVELQSNLSNTSEKLALGKTVILETDTNLNNSQHPTTKKIRIFYPLAGEVQKLEADKFLLNEQWVYFNKSTYRDKGVSLKVGQFVAVNANKNNKQQWVASRLNLNPNKISINKATFKVRFSNRIKKVVLDRRFLRMQKNWDFISRLRRIPLTKNKMQFKRKKRNPFRMPKNMNGERPPHKKHNIMRGNRPKPRPPA